MKGVEELAPEALSRGREKSKADPFEPVGEFSLALSATLSFPQENLSDCRGPTGS